MEVNIHFIIIIKDVKQMCLVICMLHFDELRQKPTLGAQQHCIVCLLSQDSSFGSFSSLSALLRSTALLGVFESTLEGRIDNENLALSNI